MRDALMYQEKVLKLLLSSLFLTAHNPEFRGRITKLVAFSSVVIPESRSHTARHAVHD